MVESNLLALTALLFAILQQHLTLRLLTMQHRVIINIVLAYTVQPLCTSSDLGALIARHNLLLFYMQRSIQITTEALLIARGLKEAALIVHAH